MSKYIYGFIVLCVIGSTCQLSANQAPIVDAGPDQYVWLGNAGNPSTATVQIDATVTDDGLPSDTLLYQWYTNNPGAVVMDPDDQEDLTAVISGGAGTYSFQLLADDTDLINTDIVQVLVAETACQAAQAMPDYEPIPTDFNGDCIVNMEDFALLALGWLECNSLECP